MGYFRTKKIDRYTLSELKQNVDEAREHVVDMILWEESANILTDALHNWGEWREALARKEGKNKSPLD